jgi:hypothetical protein
LAFLRIVVFLLFLQNPLLFLLTLLVLLLGLLLVQMAYFFVLIYQLAKDLLD